MGAVHCAVGAVAVPNSPSASDTPNSAKHMASQGMKRSDATAASALLRMYRKKQHASTRLNAASVGAVTYTMREQ